MSFQFSEEGWGKSLDQIVSKENKRRVIKSKKYRQGEEEFALRENEVLAGGRGGLRIFKMTDIYMPLSKRKLMMQEREDSE